MAVAKSRKSPSRRGMRRSHDALQKVQLATDPTSGEVHRRHHVTKDGYYRGKKVIENQGSGRRRRLSLRVPADAWQVTRPGAASRVVAGVRC